MLLLISVFSAEVAQAQMPGMIRNLPRGGGGGGGRGGGGADSLQRRDQVEDSISINFRYFDTTRNYNFDSTLNDFTKRYPIPATHAFLGNTGTASYSLVYTPTLKAGWDPGFHAFDVYKLKLENARFFNTTRPYTELGYLLGNQSQQIIEVLHTQNIKPYWNVSFNYRLINSPGFFKNQKTNHNNYLLTSWYESPKKRYNNYVVILSNSLQSSESGGIQNDTNYLNNPIYSDRFTIPVKLGGDAGLGRNFFNNSISTGNQYKEFTAMMRQQYDFGRKDSIVTDSTVIPLFYPRLRFEHTLKFNRYNYKYIDNVLSDSGYYQHYYSISPTDTFSLQDQWREINNDFSIYQFPDAKNLQQYIKAGLEFQLINGKLGAASPSLYNLIAHGEYRNLSRNKKWDINAWGRLYLNGYNAGDYHGYISLQRYINPTIGTLQVGFENVNRSPSFNYDSRSSFYLDNVQHNFSKENTTHFFGSTLLPKLKLQIKGDYFIIGNYMYLTDYYKLQQESSIFTLLRISASKKMALSRHWNLYSDVYLQQKTGGVQLNIPTIFTRNRLAFEGVFFKNLNLSTGLEIKYHTPFKGNNYSPVLGQFFYQDSITLNNRPTVDAFFHFRIKTFKAFVRAENLNSASLENGFGFTHNNIAAPDYPYPGLVIRFGFYWSFIN